jgi:hypothetical protein
MEITGGWNIRWQNRNGSEPGFELAGIYKVFELFKISFPVERNHARPNHSVTGKNGLGVLRQCVREST